MLTTVEAHELKNRLGLYLRQVEAGETILVTERGRPVAELRPLSPAALELGARLQELAVAACGARLWASALPPGSCERALQLTSRSVRRDEALWP